MSAEELAMLDGMGFAEEQVENAVRQTGTVDLQTIIEYLINPTFGQFEQQVSDTSVQFDSQEFSQIDRQITKDKSTPKMVLVVRTDLSMTPGKIAAQCCHACLEAYKKLVENGEHIWIQSWEDNGSMKITLQCPDEQSLTALEEHAKSLELIAEPIRDSGRTQVAPNTKTVVGIFTNF